MQKECPTCHRVYTELDNYCTQCGVELIRRMGIRSPERQKYMVGDEVYIGGRIKRVELVNEEILYFMEQSDEVAFTKDDIIGLQNE